MDKDDYTEQLNRCMEALDQSMEANNQGMKLIADLRHLLGEAVSESQKRDMEAQELITELLAALEESEARRKQNLIEHLRPKAQQWPKQKRALGDYKIDVLDRVVCQLQKQGVHGWKRLFRHMTTMPVVDDLTGKKLTDLTGIPGKWENLKELVNSHRRNTKSKEV